MKLSVLMCVYFKDNPLELEAAISSILSQTYPVNEIVIVKDGPLGFDLNKIIDFFEKKTPEKFKVLQLEKNVGLGRALNAGVSICKNDIIARMDADDVAVSSRFQTQIEFMFNHPQIDVCGMWIEEFNHKIGDIKKIREVPLTHNKIKIFSKFRNPINHVTVVFKKHKILEAGGYDHMPFYEDYYLWLKLIKNGCKFANIPQTGVFVRGGDGMIERRKGFVYFKNEIHFFFKIFSERKIGVFVFFTNIFFRIMFRFLPSKFLKTFYFLALRK